MKDAIKSAFSIDARALGVFRIGIAFLILVDLANRARDLVAHYTDAGLAPRADVIQLVDSASQWSLHFLNGSTLFQTTMFVLAGVAALALLVGYRTRIATIVTWVLLVSLHARNPMVLSGGDTMLRVILFWSMFLPLGARYSIDAVAHKVRRAPDHIFSAATAAILLQIAAIYFFSALLKSDPQWWTAGTATYFALSIDQMKLWFGAFLYQSPALMQFLTFFTITLEALGPPLLFSPFFRKQLRILIPALFMLWHLGLALSLKIGIFPFVGIIIWVLYFPTPVWDWFERNVAKKMTSVPLSRFDQVIAWLKKTAALPSFELKKASTVFLIFAMIYISLWNIRTVNFSTVEKIFPRWLNPIGYTLRISQYWNMFSPVPLKDDGWYVIPGTFTDGSTIDLFTGADVTWDKPEYASKLFKNQRWRKYMRNLWLSKNSGYRPLYGAYLCEQWSAEGNALESLQIYYMKEVTLPDYATEPIEQVLVYETEC